MKNAIKNFNCIPPNDVCTHHQIRTDTVLILSQMPPAIGLRGRNNKLIRPPGQLNRFYPNAMSIHCQYQLIV